MQNERRQTVGMPPQGNGVVQYGIEGLVDMRVLDWELGGSFHHPGPSRLSIEEHPAVWNKLVQDIEILEIPGQHRTTCLSGL